MERRDTGSIRDILTVLFKQKRKIIVTFLIIVIGITAATLLASPTYEARSTLLVKFGREYLYKPEVGDSRSPMAQGSQEELINSEVQILTNRDLIEQVITTLGLSRFSEGVRLFSGVSPMDAAITRFKKLLFVEPVKKSNVIDVSFQHTDPELSARAVNLLVDLFREKHLQVYADPNSSFLSEQLAGFSHRLAQAEEKLEAFKQTHGIFALDDQRALLLRQRGEAESADRDAQNRIGEANQKIVSLEAQMKRVAKNVPVSMEPERHRTTDDAMTQLLTLRLREQELLEKYREDNRLVVNVRKEIAILENFLKRQEAREKVTRGKNPVYEDMEKELYKAQAEIASLRARRTSLAGQIALLDKEIRELDRKGTELAALKREVAVNEKNYQTYLERAEEARIADTMNRHKMANVTIIQKATVPTEPVRPRTGYNIVLALVLGSISGLGLGFIAEYAGQSLSTPEGTEKRLALPVLTSVAHKG
jgi:uncharacterized protein involved in exopolysaccharide biosynthesis